MYQATYVKDAATYQEFGKRIAAYPKEWKAGANVIYYLVVTPKFFKSLRPTLPKVT